MVFKMDISM